MGPYSSSSNISDVLIDDISFSSVMNFVGYQYQRERQWKTEHIGDGSGQDEHSGSDEDED